MTQATRATGMQHLPISELSNRLERRELSSTELTRHYLDRIDRLDGQLRTFITVDADRALQAAAAADREIAVGQYRGPLHGIPIGLKDNIETSGLRTTGGSKVYADWIPPTDATVVVKLRSSGAVVIGKNNMHELGLGGTTQNPFYGDCLNPWDTSRIPGGSSGGSAAAVAAGLCAASLANDGAGSARNPAALCGVVGYKPSHGLVSRKGMIPHTQGFTHVDFGLITRTVEDAAILLQAVAGYDPRDPATRDVAVPDYRAALAMGVKGLRFGVLDYFLELIDDEVRTGYEAAMSSLESLGMERVHVVVPHLNLVELAEWTAVRVERGQALKPLLRTKPRDFSKSIMLSLLADQFIPGSYYVLGQRLRQLLIREFEAVLADVDVLVVPTIPVLAPKVEDIRTFKVELNGEKIGIGTPDGGTVLTRCGTPFNVTGLPAFSVPAAFSTSGLPIGVQIVSGHRQDDMVLRVAKAFEDANPLFRQTPPVE